MAKKLKRSYTSEVLEGRKKKALVKGWVHETRDLGKIRFLVLRDIEGKVQVTAPEKKVGKKVFDSMEPPKESVIEVRGKVKKSDKAPGGKEVIPEKIEVLSKAKQPLPIDVSEFSKTELPKRLDYRFLDLHRGKVQAIFKVQSVISMAFREYFEERDYLEMQPPSVISSASEGGTDLFSVDYFNKKAYLAQSPQLYKQMLACSMEKVFTITPVWRAEKHNTPKHLNESRQMDIEKAFAGQMEVMKELEKVVKYIVKEVKKKCKEELELLDVDLKVPKGKYLTYKETIEKLQEEGLEIEEGEDLSTEAEEKLGDLFPNTIVFVHTWPSSLKPFYIMPKGEKVDAELTESFDAIYKGLEISSGGQRVHLPELLEKLLKKKGLDPKNFKPYVDSFRYGSPIHSGWSIGLERLTQLLTGMKNIREASLFPRDRDRLEP